MTCQIPLVLHYGDTAGGDYWQCPRCRERSTPEQYLFAVQAHHRELADALTADDLGRQYAVARGSVTGWASAGKVRKRGKDSRGRQLYDVGDVLAARDGTPRAS